MKYKIPVLTLILLFILLPGFSQNRSITFVEKPWSEILAQAKAQNKMIFLDAYTTWCGPCKWMAANMFTKDTIADYYNASFICAHFDMEKGEGIKLAQTYQVKAYPTLLFINQAGEMVHKRVGTPQKIQDYLDMGNIALIPGEGFNDYMKRFQEGNRDPKFIMNYIDRLQGANMPVNEPLQQYFASQKESDLLSRTNWEMIFKYVTDTESNVFNYFFTHRKEYSKRYSIDSVDLKIINTFAQFLISQARTRSFTEANYTQLKQKIRDTGYEGAEKILFLSDISIYPGEKFFETTYADLEKYYANDYSMLANIASFYLKNTEDKRYLEKAASWAKMSIDLKSGTVNNDIYANLMFKLGNKPEAIKYEQTAIELAIKENAPTKEYEDNLKKFME
ncbi:MAG: thioredoxin family protein [Bacteroidales bacterium]|nr:thioredoxin family protein [Bacteroidales bacterium]